MRILHAVEFYDPVMGGAQEVVRQISTRLARRGHDVTVATSALTNPRPPMSDGVGIREFAVAGNAARGMTGDIGAYRDFVATGRFDVVMLYAAQQWTMDALLPTIGDIPSAVVVVPCGFSGLGTKRYRTYFASLGDHLSLADRIICHSRTYQDARWLEDAGLPFDVIPNGADEAEFGAPQGVSARRALGIPGHAPFVLLVGGHTGLKGHDEAMRAFASSSACAGGVLVLNGNHPARVGCAASCRIRSRARNLRFRDRRIVLTDLPRDELVQAYFEADVLLSTSRVECSPLVLFEAAAAGLPFVSSDAGNSSEIAEWTRAGTVVPWPRGSGRSAPFPVSAFAAALDQALTDLVRREAMSRAGRAAWSEHFTWDRIASAYEDLYEELTGVRGPAR